MPHPRPSRRLARALWPVSVLAALALAGCAAAPTTAAPETSAPPASGAPSGTPTPASTAIPRGSRVAFYGDSYTVGFGATDPSLRWSTLLCADRGWIELNDAQGGLGFLLNRPSFGAGDRVDAIIAEKPDAVVVMLGLNDVLGGYGDDPRVAERIASDIDRLGAYQRASGARLVVVEPMWFKAERPPGLQTVIDLVRAATVRAHGLFVAGASHWLDDHPDWFYSDGLHPNDAGYAQIALRLEGALDANGT
ncbi:SGNH/GDSL hydrolase family protein [Galbitalea sp. SE-J8]|uniref:SGNH/GDSL hydrolase family protein n=1 Tax=Galbitalea sp. SE-J8 TaxID=3054952 RepID=UPI00259CD245|nr:SGNH/GDSL hydrolase family protein [Galbitalea sp. SE-J8]MDM4763581.1 SGNH/GDSL hydrolase family protein [Galbitalea sp. SE-J8]